MRKQSGEIAQKANHLRKKFTGHQQGFLVFYIILFVLLLTCSLITQTTSEGGSVIASYKFFKMFGSDFTKTALVVLVLLVFLFSYNFSKQIRKQLFSIFGIVENVYLVNTAGLFTIFLVFLTIGDTTSLISNANSPTIQTSPGYLIVGFFVLAGCILNLMLARIEHKKHLNSKEVHVSQNTDTSDLETSFDQVMKDDGRLFGE